jgi:predicted glycogen debranching enzyme
MIDLTRQDLSDFEKAIGIEWLETNGLGGYASSTVLGINTRKYHSLLVAATEPPVERTLMVSRLDETVIIGGVRFEVSASEYKSTVHPRGYRYLEGVRLDPYPVFTYIVGGIKLEKSIFMAHGQNTTCVTYRIESLPNGPRTSQVMLELRPILGLRDHHTLMEESADFKVDVDVGGGMLSAKPQGELPTLYVTLGRARFEQDCYWYRDYLYRREQENGYPASEDLLSPGRFVITFEDTETAGLAFSTNPEVVDDIEAVKQTEIRRRAGIIDSPVANQDLGRHLLRAADAFLAKRGAKGRSVIAGYPWFTDWGRDSMISLPGLALVTGRLEDARRTIETFASHMDRGLIPNRFPDTSSGAEYNTIDATLWMFEAARKYYEYTDDGDFITGLLPKLRGSIKHHLDGTHYGIHTDNDGLLEGGAEGVQLTWMDAKVGGKVITARRGKAVEVNALWYNALRITADFCAEFGGLAEESRYDYLARQVFENFNKQFWNPKKMCLFDYIAGDYKDDAVRPNQIFAISLTYPVLEFARWKHVVEVVEDELLTPYGLRTLSPMHPAYKGRYGGNLETRDHAYHQGTVWPWLLGHYIRAYLRTHGRDGKTIPRCFALLAPFLDHLKEAGLGTVSEIFDGDPPHRPSGCIAQAWSVAELLRAMSEDLLGAPLTGTKSTFDAAWQREV